VLTASGALVAISKLATGQKVLAANTKTGKNQTETVAAVLVHHDTDLYDLKVRSGGVTSVIDTTSNHLFWVPGTHRWVKAGALRYGTHLRTPAGADAVVTGGYVPRQHDGWMWDLTVTSDHDFYVVPVQHSSHYRYPEAKASTPVLVHNCNEKITQEQLNTVEPGQFANGPGIETKTDPLPQDIRDAVQNDACHTCNDTQPGAGPVKIADHQPPQAFGYPGSTYRIFSQCSICSSIQNRAVQRILLIGRNHGIYNPEGAFEELTALARQHL
jgi:hypothetical protein